jgi:hypothetical protein
MFLKMASGGHRIAKILFLVLVFTMALSYSLDAKEVKPTSSMFGQFRYLPIISSDYSFNYEKAIKDQAKMAWLLHIGLETLFFALPLGANIEGHFRYYVADSGLQGFFVDGGIGVASSLYATAGLGWRMVLESGFLFEIGGEWRKGALGDWSDWHIENIIPCIKVGIGKAF